MKGNQLFCSQSPRWSGNTGDRFISPRPCDSAYSKRSPVRSLNRSQPAERKQRATRFLSGWDQFCLGFSMHCVNIPTPIRFPAHGARSAMAFPPKGLTHTSAAARPRRHQLGPWHRATNFHPPDICGPPQPKVDHGRDGDRRYRFGRTTPAKSDGLRFHPSNSSRGYLSQRIHTHAGPRLGAAQTEAGTGLPGAT